MHITIEYRDKYDIFHFIPFVKDMETAKILYLRSIWDGDKAVKIVMSDWGKPEEIVWETAEKVIRNFDGNGDLPF